MGLGLGVRPGRDIAATAGVVGSSCLHISYVSAVSVLMLRVLIPSRVYEASGDLFH